MSIVKSKGGPVATTGERGSDEPSCLTKRGSIPVDLEQFFANIHVETQEERRARRQRRLDARKFYNRQRDAMPPAEFHEVNQVSYQHAKRTKDGRWVLIVVMLAVICGLGMYVFMRIMEVIR